MNKLVKGAIAGASGFALLLGGAGTFAYWNVSSTLSTGTIHAGVLNVTPQNDAAWTVTADVAGAAAAVIPDINSYRLVPGHTLTFTRTVEVATGNDLNFTADIVGVPTDNALWNSLSINTSVTNMKNLKTTTVNGEDVYSLADPTAPAFATLTATIDLPIGTGVDNGLMNSSVSLASIKVALTQVH